MDAESIARGLDKPRKRGRSWMACCPNPSHEDRNPSFSITDSPDGKVLVKCFSGCSQEAVIEALRARGLWPAATPRQRYQAEQRERRQNIEHHRLILEIARADMKNGKVITGQMRKEIRQSVDFLKRSVQ